MAQYTLLQLITNLILFLLSPLGIQGRNGATYGPSLAGFIDVALMGVVFLLILSLDLALFVVWLERKLMARMMTRRGPTHIGPYGLFQNLADTVKLMSKEIITPTKVDGFGFHFAIAIAVITAAMSIFILPFSSTFLVSAPNAGVLLIIAVFSLYPIGVLVAGWSSNNKYSLLGGFRSAASLISYEVPMMLSMLGVLVLVNWKLFSFQRTFSFLAMANFQASNPWLIFILPIGFAVAFTAMLGETERVPFDLPEAESELVMGWRTEYSGAPFLLIMAVEYFHMFVNSGIIVYLFFGGYDMPSFLDNIFSPAVWFLIKLHIFIIIMIWVRAALPRVRIDQFLNIGWTRLMPMAIINLLLALGIGYLVFQLNVSFGVIAAINIFVVLMMFVLILFFSKRKDSVHLVDPVAGGAD